jgi:co-chaperonin GroES (HSP10)
MKAIGKNLIIKIHKEASTKTKGGLLLADMHREDIRYRKAEVLNGWKRSGGC